MIEVHGLRAGLIDENRFKSHYQSMLVHDSVIAVIAKSGFLRNPIVLNCFIVGISLTALLLPHNDDKVIPAGTHA
jgi:hypothetical protein